MKRSKTQNGGRGKLRIKRYRIHRRTAPGTAPGTIVPEPSAPRPSITVTHVTAEAVREYSVNKPREIKELLKHPGWIWCDVDGTGDPHILTDLAEVFRLHPLALEDVVNAYQRAKVEDYGDLLFVVLRFPHLLENGIVESEQISIFLGRNFLLTFQPRPGDAFVPVRNRLQDERSPLRSRGPDYLAYSLIDLAIDNYFPVLDHLAERLETLDDELAISDPRKMLTEIHDLRRELLYLRRTLWPHRDAIQSMTRDSHPLLSEATRVHLRDCWDHVTTLVELTETYRELCADLRDYCASAISNRMNEVMKWLTLIATVFIPLSFIAGVYGMNFDPDVSPWNMPELRWYLGYPFSLGLMIIVAGVMIWTFYRRGWIGQDWPLSAVHRQSEQTILPAPSEKANAHGQTTRSPQDLRDGNGHRVT